MIYDKTVMNLNVGSSDRHIPRIIFLAKYDKSKM